jgi:hypothetical protein
LSAACFAAAVSETQPAWPAFIQWLLDRGADVNKPAANVRTRHHHPLGTLCIADCVLLRCRASLPSCQRATLLTRLRSPSSLRMQLQGGTGTHDRRQAGPCHEQAAR